MVFMGFQVGAWFLVFKRQRRSDPIFSMAEL